MVLDQYVDTWILEFFLFDIVKLPIKQMFMIRIYFISGPDPAQNLYSDPDQGCYLNVVHADPGSRLPLTN